MAIHHQEAKTAGIPGGLADIIIISVSLEVPRMSYILADDAPLEAPTTWEEFHRKITKETTVTYVSENDIANLPLCVICSTGTREKYPKEHQKIAYNRHLIYCKFRKGRLSNWDTSLQNQSSSL